MGVAGIMSEYEFKYSKSDKAQTLRRLYGDYSNYRRNYVNSVMTNPLELNHTAYVEQKEQEYNLAKQLRTTAYNNWHNKFGSKYSTNLQLAKKQNGGISLNGMQRSQVLQNMGTEAVDAKKAYEQAVLSEDIALSLYNDATHDIHFNA